jgi:hypothetical protein
MYTWELPLLKQSVPWAITANMAVHNTTLRCAGSMAFCVQPAHLRFPHSCGLTFNAAAPADGDSRECAVSRFGKTFPKAGGGEDIDFCLRLGGVLCEYTVCHFRQLDVGSA